MTKTWWVARGYLASNSNPYFLSLSKLKKHEYHIGKITFTTFTTAGYLDTIRIPSGVWEKDSELRLKPGEGPVEVTLQIKYRRIGKK